MLNWVPKSACKADLNHTHTTPLHIRELSILGLAWEGPGTNPIRTPRNNYVMDEK